MRKSYLAGVVGVSVAAGLLIVAAAAAQYAAAPKPQEQAKPFTATFFGPWNEAVAKTHVPMVMFEKTDKGIKVMVHIDNHPMDPQKPHWIEWIRIEDMSGNKLAEKAFKPTDPSPPMAEFELAATYDKLKVFEHCNIHGTWLNETAVEIK
jgi:desulfoferrodoxin-like iron-binding protein